MTTAEIIDDILAHHGVKGQKWGVRKTSSSAKISSGHTVEGSNLFHSSTSTAVNNVSKKMDKAYGFKIDKLVMLEGRDAKKYIAYVEHRHKGSNVIHMQNDPNLKANLAKWEAKGWFVPTGGHNIEANITHESAHAMFHVSKAQDSSRKEKRMPSTSMGKMRQSAWEKAAIQARADGDIKTHRGLGKVFSPDPLYEMGGKLSGYAKSSLWVEEQEAELFTAYHWSPHPPKYVDAFMNDIHKSMGKKVQPFSGRKVSHA